MYRRLAFWSATLLLVFAVTAVVLFDSLFDEPGARSVPSLVDELGSRSVLGVFAHPDDEILACATLADAARRGCEVRTVTATRGERGIPRGFTGRCTVRPRAASGREGYVAESVSEWSDPSPHRTGFVVADGVRLHYLDWGGGGETVLLLPGLGSTAHAFDDIAPRLTGRFRVLALTPRGHGESESGDTVHTVERAAEDVRVLMDGLSIVRAHLVGQSISGATLTRFAVHYPGRVGKLVYLDATFDYGGADEAEEEGKAVARPRPEKGFRSAVEYRAWAERYLFGTWTNALEADMWASASASGQDAESAGMFRAALLADATAHPKEYRLVRAPALALWAEKTLDTHYFWIDRADTRMVASARDHLNARRLWERRGVDRFRREMRNGRVVAFPAHHWMIVTDEARVLREVRAFLLQP